MINSAKKKKDPSFLLIKFKINFEKMETYEIDIPFIEGLTYRLNFGNNLRTSQRYTSSQFEGNLTGRVSKRNEFYYDYTLDNILTYKKSFKKHDVTGTLLYGAI